MNKEKQQSPPNYRLTSDRCDNCKYYDYSYTGVHYCTLYLVYVERCAICDEHKRREYE